MSYLQIVAVNLASDECSLILRTTTPLFCKVNQLTSWPEASPSCLIEPTRAALTRRTTGKSRKTRRVSGQKPCCTEKIVFLDSGIVVDGKLNTTAMSTWFGPAGDPNIMEDIEQCEAIGSRSF